MRVAAILLLVLVASSPPAGAATADVEQPAPPVVTGTTRASECVQLASDGRVSLGGACHAAT